MVASNQLDKVALDLGEPLSSPYDIILNETPQLAPAYVLYLRCLLVMVGKHVIVLVNILTSC